MDNIHVHDAALLTSCTWKHASIGCILVIMHPGGGSPSDGLPPWGGGIAKVFHGRLWFPPPMQANRTQVKRRLHSANVIHVTWRLLGVQRNSE